MQLVLNRKANLLQPQSLQFVCNQGNHSTNLFLQWALQVRYVGSRQKCEHFEVLSVLEAYASLCWAAMLRYGSRGKVKDGINLTQVAMLNSKNQVTLFVHNSCNSLYDIVLPKIHIAIYGDIPLTDIPARGPAIFILTNGNLIECTGAC